MNDIEITIDILDLEEICDMLKQLKKEKDYYKKVVETHLPLFYITNDTLNN